MKINFEMLQANYQNYFYLMETLPYIARNLFDNEFERMEFIEEIRKEIKSKIIKEETHNEN